MNNRDAKNSTYIIPTIAHLYLSEAQNSAREQVSRPVNHSTVLNRVATYLVPIVQLTVILLFALIS